MNVNAGKIQLNEKSPWKTLSSEIVYENPWISVRHDKVITPGKTNGVYGVVTSKKNGLRIIAVTEDSKIILNREYRYGIGRFSYELPAGGIEADESALVCAQRELKEEAGLTADSWQQLQSVADWPSVVELTETIFVATGLHGSLEDAKRDDNEAISETKAFSMSEILQMIKAGDIFCAPSISGIFLYLLDKGLLKLDSIMN